MRTLVIYADLFLGETREIDDILAVRVDVEEIDPRAEVFHQGAQSPRVDGPVMNSLVPVELGVNRHLGLERQSMSCSDSWPRVRNNYQSRP